jgi:hypothetical protein
MADSLHPWSLIGPDTFKKVDASLPHRAYRATVGAHPLAETGILTGGGALAGYLGAGLVQKLVGGLAGRLPGGVGESVNEWLADPANQATFRNKLALLGAALGGGYGMGKNLDIHGGLGGAWRSMTEAGYWDKPENAQALRQRRLGKLIAARYRPQDAPRFQREASESSLMQLALLQRRARQSSEESGMNKAAVEKQAAGSTGVAVAKGTVGVAKDVTKGGVEFILESAKVLAPIFLLGPPVLGVGAGYMASKMTSPSKKDEEALASDLQSAELQRQIGEIARIRALARQEQSVKKGSPRGIRI